MNGKLHRIYPFITGLVFLAFGLVTLIRPEILSYYSIEIDTASARIAIRAMIGGGELGIALMLLTGGRFGLSSRERCLIAASIFMCVGLARLVAGLGEDIDILTGQPLREAMFELALGLLGLGAAKRHSASS